ncbi:hypothetical protein Moror_13016 [Moniliophthora roreri MCA 2997]|uniref:Zn(2)-C6 fungal-type domain-containing protein n=2 Tax=Moniliophthora roreri TaxID=221103 RepID=V2XJG1_MONRO|nr:hypothetical protein Moror_13016 [Moniliophthora roreri MCA 2997]KAI3616786.1 hypothetical protein WG66_004290 [Moniliophthora roreri]
MDPLPNIDPNGRRAFRTLVACTNCRRRKTRCKPHPEGLSKPCERCYSRRLSCKYSPVHTRSLSTSTPASVQIALPAPPLGSLGLQHAFSELNHARDHQLEPQQGPPPSARIPAAGVTHYFEHTGDNPMHTTVASISVPTHSYPGASDPIPPPAHYIPETSTPQHYTTLDFPANPRIFNVGNSEEYSTHASTFQTFTPTNATTTPTTYTSYTSSIEPWEASLEM